MQNHTTESLKTADQSEMAHQKLKTTNELVWKVNTIAKLL